MANVALGIFTNHDDASHAVQELHDNAHIDTTQVSVMAKDSRQAQMDDNPVASQTAEGIGVGGILGGLAGLLIGIGAFALPGIGALFIGGPLVAALGLTGAAATTASGVLTGAVAGGVVGALVGLGISQEDAAYYEKEIQAGNILIAIPVTDADQSTVEKAFSDNHAKDVRIVNSTKLNTL